VLSSEDEKASRMADFLMSNLHEVRAFRLLTTGDVEGCDLAYTIVVVWGYTEDAEGRESTKWKAVGRQLSTPTEGCRATNPHTKGCSEGPEFLSRGKN